MKHSTNQHQWEDLYISEALGLLPLRLLLSSHRTTGHNTMKYLGSRPKAHRHLLPIIISYIHITAGVSASLGSLLFCLLSSIPLSLSVSLSLFYALCICGGKHSDLYERWPGEKRS